MCLHNICVYCVYLLCINKDTHTVYILKILDVFTCIYLYLYKFYNIFKGVIWCDLSQVKSSFIVIPLHVVLRDTTFRSTVCKYKIQWNEISCLAGPRCHINKHNVARIKVSKLVCVLLCMCIHIYIINIHRTHTYIM